MKVCIKNNEFNTNYHIVFGEEKAIQDGYTIIEVPQGYEDCAFSDFDNNGFNAELYNKRKQGYENQNKLAELTNWFNEYDLQVKQYTRCQRLGIEFDKNMAELDNQAEINAKRIKELREEIKEGENL